MVRLCAKKYVIIFENDIIRQSIHFKNTVNSQENNEKPSIIVDGKTLDKINPQNPISKTKQIGETHTYCSKFREKEKKHKIEEH
jgi:hypothetical protein